MQVGRPLPVSPESVGLRLFDLQVDDEGLQTAVATLARDPSFFSDFRDFGAAKLPTKVDQEECVELGLWVF